MPLTVHARQVRDTAILDLTGRLTLGPSLSQFESQATRALTEWKPRRLLLNVEGLSQVDSSGVGQFITFYGAASRLNCRVAFVAPAKNFRQVLRITRLDGVVPIFDTEAAALAPE